MNVKLIDAGPVDSGYVVIIEINGKQHAIPTDAETATEIALLLTEHYVEGRG